MSDDQFKFICDRLKFIEERVIHLEAQTGALKEFVLLASLAGNPEATLESSRSEFRRIRQQILNTFAEWHVSEPPPPPAGTDEK